MKTFRLFFLACLCMFLAACDRAPSNVHILSTSDCGATWSTVPTGSAVPKHKFDPCGYNTAIPNWPMSGDTAFRTQFNGQVTTVARVSYVYEITEPKAFIKEARYLGKMGGSLEISADTIGDRYEMAENTIIDKIIREVTTDVTRGFDLVTVDPTKLEAGIQAKVSKELKAKGIELGEIAFTLDLDELTRQAIDTTTAVRIYTSAGIGDLGKDIMKARAGANHITVNADHTPVAKK